MAFLLQTGIFIIAICFAVTVHEFAHAWVAYQLGDPTAKKAGRISLNPIKHIDPIGFLTLLIFKIGWGKPVPVNQYNLKHPRRDQAIISLAGPAANFVTASLLTIPFTYLGPAINPLFATLIEATIFINIILMVFNLIPIPPLDGSKVLFALLPNSMYKVEEVLTRNGPFILLGVLLLDHMLLKYFSISILGTVIGGGVNAVMLLLQATS